MTTPLEITSEIQKLAPSSIIELFEIDASAIGGDATPIRFHAGTNELRQNIVFDGNTYTRYPVQVQGFEKRTGGQLPRPKLAVSNLFGTITTILVSVSDLIGAKVTRIRTLAKYLDAVNFDGGVNPSADPSAQFVPDIYFVDRKTIENRDVVEFELAAAIDLENVVLPRRQIIQNVCPWTYRSAECSYSGSVYYDTNDNQVFDPTRDVCGKRLSSCKLRFGSKNPLPFGGFVGSGLIK